MYCDNNVLKTNCQNCGCPSGQSCNATSNTCYWPPCGATPPDQCSATKPSYCSNGRLINRCSICGCPTATAGTYTCDPVSEGCALSCSDGTFVGQCSAVTAGKLCGADRALKDDCASCSCMSPWFCNATSNACQLPTCSDGTIYGQCSVNLPYKCDLNSGLLIHKCTECGCPTTWGGSYQLKGGIIPISGTYFCNSETEYCYYACIDGTLSGECSTVTPGMLCAGKYYELYVNCDYSCPCPSGYTCDAAGCIPT